jgi:hypothetical protein
MLESYTPILFLYANLTIYRPFLILCLYRFAIFRPFYFAVKGCKWTNKRSYAIENNERNSLLILCLIREASINTPPR